MKKKRQLNFIWCQRFRKTFCFKWMYKAVMPFVLLLLLIGGTVSAQSVITITPQSNPSVIVPSGDPVDFRVQVTNTQLSPVAAGWKLKVVTTPKWYVNSATSGSTLTLDSRSGDTCYFLLPAIAAETPIIIVLNVTPKCGIVAGEDKFYYTVYDASGIAKSDLNKETSAIANIFNTILAFTPQASTTVKLGVDTTRTMSITQTQANSYAPQIKVEHVVDTTTLRVVSLEVSVNNSTWIPVPAANIIRENGKYTYNFNASVFSALGLTNNRLAAGQTIYFKETIRYVSCNGDGVSNYTITYGKDNVFCAATTTGVAQVSTASASFTPNIIQVASRYIQPRKIAGGHQPGVMMVRALNNSTDVNAVMKDVLIPTYHGVNRGVETGYNFYRHTRAYLINNSGQVVAGPGGATDTIFIPVQNNRAGIAGIANNAHTYFVAFDAMDAETNAKIAYARTTASNNLDLDDLDGDGMYNDLPAGSKGVSVAIEFLNDYSILTPCMSQLRAATVSYAQIAWKNTCGEYQKFIQGYTTDGASQSTQIWRTRWFFPALKESKIIPGNITVGDQVVLKVHEGYNSGSTNGGEFNTSNSFYEHFVEITLPQGFEWEPSDPNSKIQIGIGNAAVGYTVPAAEIISYDPSSRVLRIKRNYATYSSFASDNQYYLVTVRVLPAIETVVSPNNASLKHIFRFSDAPATEYTYSCSSISTAYNLAPVCSDFVLDSFAMRRATFGFKSATDQTPITEAEQQTKNQKIAFPYDKVIVDGVAHVAGAVTQSPTNKLVATFSYTRNSTTRYFDKQTAQITVKRSGVNNVHTINDDKVTHIYDAASKTHSISIDCQSIGNLQVNDSVFLELATLTRGDIPDMIANIPDIKFQWNVVNNATVPNCNVSLQTDFILRNNRKRGVGNTSNGSTYNIGRGTTLSLLMLTNNVLGTTGDQYAFSNVEARPNYQVISDTVVYKINGLVKVKQLQNRFFSVTTPLIENTDYTVTYTPTQTVITILNPQSINNGYSSMTMTYADSYYIEFDHIYYPGNLSVYEYARIIDLPTSENPLERSTAYGTTMSRTVYNYNYNLSSAQPLAEPLSNRAQWPITVTNLTAWGSSYSNDTLHHSWVAVEDPTGSLYDFELVHNATGQTYAPIAYQSLDNNNTYYWFKIGDLKASAENFTLSARYTSCASQINFTAKYSCGKGDYPYDPVRGFYQYGESNYKNTTKTTTLSLLPPQGAVSGTLAVTTSPADPAKPGVYDMCNPICYKATVQSAMSSYLYNPVVLVRKGDGMTWDGSTPTATYGGTPVSGTITVQETADSILFILPNTLEIEGFSSGKTLEVDFCLTLGNGFVANTPTYAYLIAETGCGESLSFLANTSNIKVDGMPENMPIYSMINFEVSDLRYSATGEGTMTLTGIYNIIADGAPGASSFITLPDNLRLVSGTLTSGSYTSNYSAGRDKRMITAPFGETPELYGNGVEYTVNLTLRATSPGSWSCRTDSIITSSGITATIICSQGTYKISQVSDIDQVQPFTVSKLDLAFEQSNTTMVGEYYSATEEKVTITTRVNNNSSTSSGAIKVELYLDYDGDGVFSFGDAPVLGNPFIGIADIGGYNSYEISKSFIINADDVCKLMLVVNQETNPYICNTIAYAPATKDYEMPQDVYTVCQGSDVEIGTEAMDNYTYEWTPNQYLSAANVANPTFNYTAAITTQQTLTYYLKITRKDGCEITKQIDVIVNPLPHLNVPLKLDTICTGGVAYTEIGTATPGDATFAWLRLPVAGINGGAATTGTGTMLLDVLNNTNDNLAEVNYIYTTTINGCSGRDTISINIFGQASVGNLSTPASICDGSRLILTIPAIKNGGAEILSQGWELDGNAFNPNTALTTLDNGKSLRYVITTRCGEYRSNDVSITVNAIPKLSSAKNAVVCSGEELNYTSTSATTGVSYTWTRKSVSGITNGARIDMNGANIRETLVSTLSAPVNALYEITLVSNECSNTDTLRVTVNPKPELNNIPSLANRTICSGGTFTYTNPSSNVSGVSITWERQPVNGIAEGTNNGSGTISEVLTNTTANPVIVTYDFTVQANGCINTQSVQVTVNPEAELSSALYINPICSGGTVNYTARTSSKNVTFSWSRAAVTGITPATGSGATASINEILTNSTTNPVTVQYLITMKVGDCTSSELVDVVVNPIPAMASTTTMPLCSGDNFVHDISSSTENANYVWIRQKNNDIIEPAATGTGSLISEALTVRPNVSTPVNVNYTVITEANGCKNNGQTVTVTVNPLPEVTIISPTPITLAANASQIVQSSTNGRVVSWSSSNISIATVTAETDSTQAKIEAKAEGIAQITLEVENALTGCTNTVSFTVNVGAENTATMSLAAGAQSQLCNGSSTTLQMEITGGKAPFTVVYNDGSDNTITVSSSNGRFQITPAINSGNAAATTKYTLKSVTDKDNQPVSVIASEVEIEVNPTAKIVNTNLPNTSICEGGILSLPRFETNITDVNKVTYVWYNDNPGIGLSVSGSGHLTTFRAENGSGADITGTITAVATYNGLVSCQDLTQEYSFNITVYPKPNFTVVNPEAICAGTSIDLNAKASEIIHDVTPVGASVEFFTLRSCTPASKVIAPVSPLQTTIYYAKVISANGCESEVQEVVITVNPVPTADAIIDQAVCNNNGINIQLTGVLQGTTYEWHRTDSETNIVGLTTEGTNAVYSGRLSNSTFFPVTATIAVVPKYSSNGITCVGDTMEFNITVNPTPTLSGGLAAPGICSGESPEFNLNLSTPFTVVTWERLENESISEGPQTITSNKISETLTNLTQKTVNVRYAVTLEIGSCTNTQYITVPVYPMPELSSDLQAGQICSGGDFVYQGTTAVTGATIQWERQANPSIAEPATSGYSPMPINETLTNTTANPVIVKYNVKISANGCEKTQEVEVIVGPTLELTSTDSLGIFCSGEPIIYKAESASNNIQYSWYRKFNAYMEPTQSSGTGANISEILYNNSNVRQEIEYVITMTTSNNCQAEYTVKAEVCAVPDISVSEPQVTIAAGATRILKVSDMVPSHAVVTIGDETIATVSFNPSDSTLTVTALKAGRTEIVYATSCENYCENQLVIPVTVTNGPIATLELQGIATVCSGGTTELQITNIQYGKGPWQIEVNYAGGDASSAVNVTINSLMDLPYQIPGTLPANNSNTYALQTYTVTRIEDSEGSVRTTHMGKPTITVIPVPTVDAISNQEVCNGSKNDVVYFGGVATNYKWSVDKAIGIDLMGDGIKLPAYELGHNNNAPVVATVTVTPEYTINNVTCVGTSGQFTITVNPLPMVDAITNIVSCHESAISIPITGTNATEYIYTAAPSIGLPSGGRITNGNSLDFTTDNMTSGMLTGEIMVTPVYAGVGKECYGTPVTFKVDVKPRAILTSSKDNGSICSGTQFVYEATSTSDNNVHYKWERPSLTGINEDAPAQGQGRVIRETLTNSTDAPIVVYYILNLEYEGCESYDTINVIVNPTPVIQLDSMAYNACPSDIDAVLTYTTSNASLPIEYMITFDSEARRAGFDNMVAYASLQPDEILVSMPRGIESGRYNGTIVIRSYSCSGEESYPFTINVMKPTSIIEQPESEIISCNGGVDIYLEVVAQGETLTYQWYKDGVAITGETASVYQKQDADTLDHGEYYVEVSGICGTVQSEVAKVVANPAYIQRKWDEILFISNVGTDGVKLQFVSYQWYRVMSTGKIVAVGVKSNKQYYEVTDKTTESTYMVEAFYADGSSIMSCPFTYTPIEESSFKLYPNPVLSNEKVNIMMENKDYSGNITVEVFDAQGIQVYKGEMQGTTMELPMQLSSGVYMVRIMDKSGVIKVEKVIVK